jgi:hypothetical protein
MHGIGPPLRSRIARWLLARGKVEDAQAVVENLEKGRFENFGGSSAGFVA